MTINGKHIGLDGNMPLKTYLERMNYDLSRIAVEKNGAVIPQNAIESEILCDDDTLEIVCFVGGG
jgi:thiamine biosynthesis protein ThiS